MAALHDQRQLVGEWLAKPDLGAGDLRALEGIGITRKAIALAGGMARCRVRLAGRIWTPDECGKSAAILPVWAGSAPSIWNAVESPILIDLLALDLTDHSHWWYRLGDGGGVLGPERLELAHLETIPLVLFTSPLEWLRAECKGACLLDYVEGAWAAEHELAQAEATAKLWRVSA